MDVPPTDEDLPGQDRPTTGRRTRVAVAVVVVAAAVVGVVLATRADRPRRDARPPATSSAVRITSPPPPPCLDVGGSRLNCGVSPMLPTSTLRALQTVLPGASVVVASTVVGRNGRVYSRRTTIRRDTSTLQLTIGPSTGEIGSSSVLDTHSGAGVSYAADIGRHRVQVAVRGPLPVPAPTVDALRRLAEDPRLTVP